MFNPIEALLPYKPTSLVDGSGMPVPDPAWLNSGESDVARVYASTPNAVPIAWTGYLSGERRAAPRFLLVGALLGVVATLAYKHFRP